MYYKSLIITVAILLRSMGLIAQPQASFHTVDTLGCAPHSVQFVNTSTGATAYSWNFGNGASANVANPVVLFDVPGTYTISLTATDANGVNSIETKTAYITVESEPVANFSFTTASNCQQGVVTSFTNNSTGGATYLYDFDDGNQSIAANPTHTYTQAGSYHPVILVTSAGGCFNSFVSPTPIVVAAPTAATFSVDDPFGCDASQVFTFTNTSANSSATSWDFGDGTTGIGTTASHQYALPGYYTVTMTNTDQNGCQETRVEPNFVEVFDPAAVNITANTTQGCAPLSVNFSHAATNGVQTQWSFSHAPQNVYNGNTVSETFSTAGTYDVYLEFTHSSGCIVQDTLFGYVEVYNNPTVSISANGGTGCLPDSYNFISNSSCNNCSYYWDFGDGFTSNQPNPTHVYTLPGTFTANLQVTDASGCTGNATYGPITFNNSSISFTADQLLGCGPLTVQFTDQSSNVVAWNWNFGDGSSSAQQHPLHTYQLPGTYDVQLITTNSNGCSDTLNVPNYITVNNPIPPIATNQTFQGCAPFSAMFMGSDLGYNSWTWDFGDGNTSTSPDPVHTYSNPGTYNVSLTSYTDQGCVFTIQTYATVNVDGPALNFDAEQVTCFPLQVDFTDLTSNAISWDWSFGNGSTSTQQHPSTFYGGPGLYAVSLEVNSPNGCSRAMVQGIQVTDSCIGGAPVGASEMIGSSGSVSSLDTVISTPIVSCLPYLTQFIHMSDTAVSHQWNFGDGYFSSQADPWHTYTQPGIYDVTYIATFANGTADTLFFPQLFHLQGTPAQFNFSPVSTCDSLTVDFASGNPGMNNYFWNFGDSTFATGENTQHTYPINNSSYAASLTIVDSFGCSSTTSMLVPAFGPNFDFVADSLVCNGDTFEVNISLPSGYSIAYDFGDGSPISNGNTHLYAAAGNYNVMAIVTDSLGCSMVVPVLEPLEVYAPNSTFFTLSPTQGCIDHTVIFSPNLTTGSAYSWTVDNNITLNGISPSFTYTQVGLYDVSLTVTDQGCTSTTTVPEFIETFDAQAAFSWNSSGSCLPVTFTFTDLSIDAINWWWDFGDGHTSMQQHPSHTFVNAPAQPVSLTITDSAGCTASYSMNVVNVHQSDFTSDVQLGCGPLTVNFSDLTMGATSWFWNFGDGNTSPLQNPVHTYTQAGLYDVMLVTISAQGCIDTLIIPNYIDVGEIDANFTFNASTSCAPSVAMFTNLSVDADSVIWDFGDGSGSVLNTPIHVYTQPGTYTVQLTTFNQYGCVDSFTHPQPIVVLGPVADFTVGDTTLCTGDELIVNDFSQNASTYQWFFGDGNGDSLSTPTYQYPQSGVYTVSLLVTDSSTGCISVYDFPQSIHVQDYPVADFSLQNIEGCEPLSIQVTDLSQGVSTMQWDFGNGQTPTHTPPTVTYFDDGLYDISLAVANDFGCADTMVFQSVTVYEQLTTSILGPQIICINDGPTAMLADTTGGLWGGHLDIDASTGEVTPSSTGAGSFTVFYTIDGHCPGVDSLTLNIVENPDASIHPAPEFCADDTVYQLSAVDTGGVWSGAGIVDSINGWFDPAVATPGTHLITYHIGGTCEDTDSIYLQVHHLPNLNITASENAGCPDLPVTFNVNSSDSLTDILWDLQPGNTSTDSAYSVTLGPGSYDISISATNQYGCSNSTTAVGIVEVFDNQAPDVPDVQRVSVHSDTEVLLEWLPTVAADFDHYVIFRQNLQTGVFDSVGVLFNQSATQFVDGNLNTMSNSYCYRIASVDYCGFTTSTDVLETHCTINIEAQINGHVATVDWNFYEGATPASYKLYRILDNDTLMIASLPAQVNQFVDTSLYCNTKYTYCIKGVNLDGTVLFSNSDHTSVISLGLDPEEFQGHVTLTTVADNTHTIVEWTAPPIGHALKGYDLYRSVDGNAYEWYNQFNDQTQSFEDFDVDVEAHRYLYRVETRNSCWVTTAEARPGSSILLVGEKTTDRFGVLTWSNYEQWENGVAYYEVQVLSGTYWKTLTTINHGPNEFQADLYEAQYNPGKNTFRIQAFEMGGAAISTSNELTLINQSQLFIPSAFSPDGDNRNDLFLLKGHNIADYEIHIYNRWGQEVFFTQDINTSWDGSYQGQNAPVGSYLYRVQAYDTETHQLIQREGMVSLIK